ncbi:MAG: alpha-amylase [Muribaculaceae bacterium]|nr:alpha-amylase [Muribaculaceae bacterium]
MKTQLSALVLALAALSPQASAENYGTVKTSVNHPDWAPTAVIYEMNLRQGTPERNLKGAAAQLPRLRELGIDVVWLMPIHPISELNRKGTLGSYYAVKNYKDVNPEFGTIQDLKDFVKQAHELGMKVILDEVCNHSGCDNAWVKEHPDYYATDESGKMFGPFDWTDTYKLDYSNPDMRAAMLDALKFWIEECDIDGYRCDVAMEVPTDFWDSIRPQLEEIKPVFMLAEASKPELTLKSFDADYAWPMKDVFNAIAAKQGVNEYAKLHNQKFKESNALSIDTLLNQQALEYPMDTYRMNMVTNHDLNSWEGTEFERYGDGMEAFAVLSYTLPGMPMMYTGQEVGFNHAFEFFENDSVIPDYTPNKITAFYKKLNDLKHSQPALRAGDTGGKMIRYATASPDIYIFERVLPENKVLTVLNLSNQELELRYDSDNVPDLTGMKNWFDNSDATLPTHLKPWEYFVFVQK